MDYKSWVGKLYLDVREKWNELRLKDADPEVLRFLLWLMNEFEVMLDEPRQGN